MGTAIRGMPAMTQAVSMLCLEHGAVVGMAAEAGTRVRL